MSQPSQEDACAEAFSQDSLGVRYKETFEARHLTWFLLLADLGDFFRIKAATALYMVAVVEVSESQIIGIWITLDHSGSLWIILDHTGIQ